MRIAVLTFFLLASGPNVSGQILWPGTLWFANRNNSHPDGGGQTYNIPIWYLTRGDGAGDLPGGVRASLFRPDNLDVPLATATLRTTTFTEFFGSPSAQSVSFPDLPGGATPELVFRVWQGANLTYDGAVLAGNPHAEVRFTSLPLGASGPGQGWTPPGMNFSLDSSGIVLLPEPTSWSLLAAGGLFLLVRRRGQSGGGRVFG